MKKLFCFVLLLTSFLSTSQIREKGAIEITPIVGYSISQYIHAIYTGSSSVSGVQFGVYGDYFFNEKWSFHSGLLYQSMGTDKIDFIILESNYTESTNYITLPLTMNFHFGRKKNWYLNYGPSVGVLISAKADYHDGNGSVDIKDIAHSFQFGLNGGIGYKFEVSPKFSITIENSNMVGLTTTTNEDKGNNFYMSFNIGGVFKI